jgi:hypothetical protein
MAKINPERGTKVDKGSRRKSATPHNGRVLSLLSNLAEYENPWTLA